MAFTRKTLTQLINDISGDIEQEVTGNDKLLRRSKLKIIARTLAGACHLMYSFLTYKAEQLFATTADLGGLENIGDEYGMTINGSVQAEGDADVTGVDGSVITAGTELQDASGVLFTVQSEATVASGTATMSLIANEGGQDGNKVSGETLYFLSTPTGITSDATVGVDGITGGEDAESTEEFRLRILRRKQYPPYGGTESDYETWMLEYSGVSRAWVFPSYQGAGTVGCAFVNDSNSPITPDSTYIANVRSYLVGHEDELTGRTIGIPLTAEPGLFMITLSELDVDVEVNTTPNNSETQADIEAELADMIVREGGPTETIGISDIHSALSRVTSITDYTLVSPVAGITADNDEVHVLGTVTFGGL